MPNFDASLIFFTISFAFLNFGLLDGRISRGGFGICFANSYTFLKKHLLKPDSKLHKIFWNKNYYKSKPQHTTFNSVIVLNLYFGSLLNLFFDIATLLLGVYNFSIYTIFIKVDFTFKLIDMIFLPLILGSLIYFIDKKYSKIELNLKSKELCKIKVEIEKMYPNYFEEIVKHD